MHSPSSSEWTRHAKKWPLLRGSKDGQDTHYLPPLRLLDHHQVDVKASLGGVDAWISDGELRRRVDLRHAPADRNDSQLFPVDVDAPSAPVTLLEALERGLPAPDRFASADPEKVRGVRQKASHRLQIMRVLDSYVLVEDGAHFVFHCRGMSQRRDRRERGEKKESLYHSSSKNCLPILTGPAWIRTRDQRIMCPLL